MTIDEAIAHEREVAKKNRDEYEFECSYFGKETVDNGEKLDCVRCAEEHEQLAEWLEELKAFQENKWTDIYIKRGYNKAIEDFVKEISESNKGHWRPTKYEHGEVVSETMSYDIGTIRLIAEQLKAGGENGD